MTAVDVDALDAARAAAGFDGWRYDPREPHTIRDSHPRLPAVLVTFRDPGADAALIVAAVNALPALLAEVRRGRALRERLEGLAEQFAEAPHDHGIGDGHASCAACWVADIRAVLAAVDPS